MPAVLLAPNATMFSAAAFAPEALARKPQSAIANRPARIACPRLIAIPGTNPGADCSPHGAQRNAERGSWIALRSIQATSCPTLRLRRIRPCLSVQEQADHLPSARQ